MDWLFSLLYGLISGLSQFFPVSSYAHGAVFTELLGQQNRWAMYSLFCHLAALGALLLAMRDRWRLLLREDRIYRASARRRPRPADGKAVYEFRFLKTAGLIGGISMLLTVRTRSLGSNFGILGLFLLANCLVLWAPSLLPSGNRDARGLRPTDGSLTGIGAVLGIFPGISPISGSYLVASALGFDGSFALELCLLMMVPCLAGSIVSDLVLLVSVGGFHGAYFVKAIVAAIGAFLGSYYSVSRLRRMANSFGGFAWYSFGAALFCFVLFLMV